MKYFREIFWIFLWPLSYFWARISEWKIKSAKKDRSKLKVISIGNIHSGGTGKTPMTMAIAQELKTKKNVVILSRGYKARNSARGAEVDLNQKDKAKAFGDEAVLMAEKTGCKVYIGKNRKAWLSQLESENPVVLLEDGFQHTCIHRDLDLVLLPTERSPRDLYCLPLGELREPVTGLSRADAFLFLDEGLYLEEWKSFLTKNFSKTPSFTFSKSRRGFFKEDKFVQPPGSALAFASIASPERFMRDVQLSIPHLETKFFPDHYSYRPRDIQNLVYEMKKQKLECLVTTEKDQVKLSAYGFNQAPILVYKLEYVLTEDFKKFLEEKGHKV